jgi:hypothetical protein
MLAHQSVKQTEDYAIIEQRIVSREMAELKHRLGQTRFHSKENVVANITRLQRKINHIKQLLES